MSAHFHLLKVKTVKKETSDCVVITFHLPGNLQEIFKFSQGQNLTLKKSIDGEELRRTYSICTAPYEGQLSIAVKKVDAGRFSTYANEVLQPGDTLEVLAPTGSFFSTLDSTHQQNYLAFAAGSGITPVISLVKATLATEPGATFTLVYANRYRQSIIFFEELAALKNKYMNRFNLVHVLSREQTPYSLHQGRIDAGKLAEMGKLINYVQMDEIFICGPAAMTFSIKEYLLASGIAQRKIHVELFNAAGLANQPQPLKKATLPQGVSSNVSIRLDGRSFDFKLAFGEASILEAALKMGADLPYACKGGVCSTCRALLISGEVSMDANYALGPDELEKGFILTCQSHPLTETIVIDFDTR